MSDLKGLKSVCRRVSKVESRERWVGIKGWDSSGSPELDTTLHFTLYHSYLSNDTILIFLEFLILLM